MMEKGRRPLADKDGHADVSVVIPVYNAVATLERALNSVFAQTMRPAEVIVIDDGSTDDSARLIAEIAEQHPEQTLALIRHDRNMGVSAARNSGWEAATSRYIAFLDADDAWHPEKIRIQYGWMTENPAIGLCGHACPQIQKLDELVVHADMNAGREYGITRFLLSNPYSTCTVMLRRDLPYRFTAGKQHSEDYLLWLQIVSSGVRAVFLPQPLAGIFKPAYGQQGLTENLWNMEQGELDSYRRLRMQGELGKLAYLLLVIYSLSKYGIRVIRTHVRKNRTPKK